MHTLLNTTSIQIYVCIISRHHTLTPVCHFFNSFIVSLNRISFHLIYQHTEACIMFKRQHTHKNTYIYTHTTTVGAVSSPPFSLSLSFCPLTVYHYCLLLLLLGLHLLTRRLPLPGGILALPSNEANNVELTFPVLALASFLALALTLSLSLFGWQVVSTFFFHGSNQKRSQCKVSAPSLRRSIFHFPFFPHAVFSFCIFFLSLFRFS